MRGKGTVDGYSVGPIVGLSSRISSKQSKVGFGSTGPYASSRPTGGMPIRWGATAVYRWITASRASRVGVRGSQSTPDGGPTGSAKRTPSGPSGSGAWPGAGSDSAASLNGSTGGAKTSGRVESDGATSSPGPPCSHGIPCPHPSGSAIWIASPFASDCRADCFERTTTCTFGHRPSTQAAPFRLKGVGDRGQGAPSGEDG